MACSGGGGAAGSRQHGSRSPSPAAAAVGPPFPPTCSNTLGIPDHPHGRVRMYLDADVPGPDGELPYMKLYRSASDDDEDEDYEEPEEDEDDNENVDPNEMGDDVETEEEHDFDRIPRHPPVSSSEVRTSPDTTTDNSQTDPPSNNNTSVTTQINDAEATVTLPDRTSGSKRRSSPDGSDGSPETKYRSCSETD